MTIRFLFWLLLGLLATTAVKAQDFECRFAGSPIEIDGKLDEAAWKDAQLIDRFAMPWLPGKPAAQSATRARLLWDREFLYFAAELDDVDLFADLTRHDDKTWHNDVFELFLRPAADKSGYYEFHVTAAGTIADVFIPEPGKITFKPGERDDEFHITAQVRCAGTLNERTDRDHGWVVEAKMPWFDFLRTGGRPDAGETWRFALCRYDYRCDRDMPELSTSAPLSQPNFHLLADYAALRFMGPRAEQVGETIDTPQPHPLKVMAENWQNVPSRVVGSPETPPPYRVERARPALRINFPVTMIPEPGSQRLFFVDQNRPYGSTRLCRTIDDPTSGEFEMLLESKGMMLSLDCHPRYSENGFLYVGGTLRSEGKSKQDVYIKRFTIGRSPPFKFDPASAITILEFECDGHMGGAMAFGTDGKLFVTSGDGSSDSDELLSGQRLDHLLAKVLRIDVDHPSAGRAYSIPADNPFVGQPNVRPETWAYGFRNPWRLWIDPPTGQVWVGNNGQDLWEQVYLVERGANYGWSVYEGGHIFNANRQLGPTPVSKPIFDHPHSEARSLTGGVVYRGKRLPDLHGAYIYGDYASGKIWGAKVEGGKVLWHRELASTVLSITSFGLDHDGELLIADHLGNDAGGFYTLIPNDEPDRSVAFPRTLSATGLFASVAEHRLAVGMIPYSVNSPLWSDGASKERAIYLPPTAEIVAPTSNGSRPPRTVPGTREPARIDVLPDRGWNLPEHTVLVKSFALEMEAGNPQSRRWIETRLLTRQGGEWVGYSYAWNDEQTEAALVARDGLDRTFERRIATGLARQSWRYPSRAECMLCHSRAANFVLGLSTAQLNKVHDYGGVRANQLEVLESLGVLRIEASSVERAAKAAQRQALIRSGLSASAAGELARSFAPQANQRTTPVARLWPESVETQPRLVDPLAQQEEPLARVRSYLHANCSHCHTNAGGGNAQIDLVLDKPLDKTGLLDGMPLHDKFGITDARIIAAGKPDRSVLLHRLSKRGPGQMPQLATSVVDDEAVKLLREWIASLEPSKPDGG